MQFAPNPTASLSVSRVMLSAKRRRTPRPNALDPIAAHDASLIPARRRPRAALPPHAVFAVARGFAAVFFTGIRPAIFDRRRGWA
jgi:hypothetical protein